VGDDSSGFHIAGCMAFIMVVLLHIEVHNLDQGTMFFNYGFFLLIPRPWSLFQGTDLDNCVQYGLAPMVVLLQFNLVRALHLGANVHHGQRFDYTGSGSHGPMLVVQILHWKKAASKVQSHLPHCSLLCSTSNQLNSSSHTQFGLLCDVLLLALGRSSGLLAVLFGTMGEAGG
jgi:hypothetical protein